MASDPIGARASTGIPITPGTPVGTTLGIMDMGTAITDGIIRGIIAGTIPIMAGAMATMAGAILIILAVEAVVMATGLTTIAITA